VLEGGKVTRQPESELLLSLVILSPRLRCSPVVILKTPSSCILVLEYRSIESRSKEGEIPLFDARKEQFSRIVFYLFF